MMPDTSFIMRCGTAWQYTRPETPHDRTTQTKHCAKRAVQALRPAAALRTSQSALGTCYRRPCARMDKPKSVTAAAHKLARLIHAMLTRGEARAPGRARR